MSYARFRSHQRRAKVYRKRYRKRVIISTVLILIISLSIIIGLIYIITQSR